MATNRNLKWIGMNELRAAVNRNPQMVLNESKKFLTRGMAAYKSTIINKPWRMGMLGGGAPHDSGNLRDTHKTVYKDLTATIGPDQSKAAYAPYVHGIDGYPRKRSYQLRPWLDHAASVNKQKIISLEKELLYNITIDLAR